jgi:dienelactone hydrolase
MLHGPQGPGAGAYCPDMALLERQPRSAVPAGRALGLVLVALMTLALPATASDRETLAAPGPHETAAADVVVSRPDGSTFEARLHYPLPSTSDDGTQAAAGQSPVVAFGHGYQTPVDLYEGTLAHLASWGITVIAPRSGGELFPSHQAFADDLRLALDWVAAEASRGSWPGRPVDPAARGSAGHSMGGGAAVLAAADDPTIRTVATLAAAETDPSAIEAASRLVAPALFLAGSADAITPPQDHQRPIFEAKAVGPAQLRTIAGGSHCGFLDSETLLLSLVCDDGTIERDEQLATTRAVLTAWLRHELAADGGVADLAWPDGPDSWTEVETN